MKYVLVFVLLTCVLSASIKERMETAAQATSSQDMGIGNKQDCLAAGGYWLTNAYPWCSSLNPADDPNAYVDHEYTVGGL